MNITQDTSKEKYLSELIPKYKQFLVNRENKNNGISAPNIIEVDVLVELNQMGLPSDPNGLVYLADGVCVDSKGNLH